MDIYCTVCSKNKDESPEMMPAIDRYLSENIKAIYSMSRAENVGFRILSGDYGLLRPEQEIPYYDKRLEPEEVPVLEERIRRQIVDQEIGKVVFFFEDPERHPNWKPYIDAMKRACSQPGITYEERIIAEK